MGNLLSCFQWYIIVEFDSVRYQFVHVKPSIAKVRRTILTRYRTSILIVWCKHYSIYSYCTVPNFLFIYIFYFLLFLSIFYSIACSPCYHHQVIKTLFFFVFVFLMTFLHCMLYTLQPHLHSKLFSFFHPVFFHLTPICFLLRRSLNSFYFGTSDCAIILHLFVLLFVRADENEFNFNFKKKINWQWQMKGDRLTGWEMC